MEKFDCFDAASLRNVQLTTWRPTVALLASARDL